jgi:hypothetical protein
MCLALWWPFRQARNYNDFFPSISWPEKLILRQFPDSIRLSLMLQLEASLLPSWLHKHHLPCCRQLLALCREQPGTSDQRSNVRETEWGPFPAGWSSFWLVWSADKVFLLTGRNIACADCHYVSFHTFQHCPEFPAAFPAILIHHTWISGLRDRFTSRGEFALCDSARLILSASSARSIK